MSNRVVNCLRMLEILRSHQLYKKQDLAHLLNTNVRNISLYKDDLYDAGYQIDVITGKYGGYILNDQCLIPTLNINDTELSALIRANDYLNNTNFFYQDALNEALIKIRANIDYNDVNHESYFKQAPLNNIDKINHYYQVINEAINKKLKLNLNYYSMNSKVYKELLVHPYELVRYQDFWYLLAKDEQDEKKMKYYKLSSLRIKDLSISNLPFYYDEDFKISNYTGEQSLFNNQSYTIKCEVYNEAAVLVYERNMGLNAQHYWIEKPNILFLEVTFELLMLKSLIRRLDNL